jgi:hypothetical protein
MRDRVPDVSLADVERIVRRDFSPAEHATVLELLEEFKDDSPGVAARVRVAILKLCKGRTDNLLHYVSSAQGDCRDVLAWAEYSRVFDLPSDAIDREKELASAADWQEYHDWFHRA